MSTTPPPFENLDNSPVWELVDQASSTQASGHFTDDVMRSVRLSEEPQTAWWKKLLGPIPIGLTATAAAVVISLTVFNTSDPSSSGTIANDTNDVEPQLEEAFQDELLLAAVEHPDLFTDEEVLALLY